MLFSPGRALRIGVIAAIAFCFIASTRAEAAGCAPDNYTEAGTCAPVMVDPPMTPFQRDQQAAKDAALAAMNGNASPAGQRSARLYSTNPGDGATAPTDYQLKEVQDMTIFKEGQGNLGTNGRPKAYTCGPSATRNMVAAMYRVRSGIWKDFGEQTFEDWEGTRPAEGTSRGHVANALNAHFSSFGHWTTSRPANAAAYLNAVKLDTFSYHQSVIANVDTEYLKFFAGHALDHFDFVYGYYEVGTAHNLRIGEEWDPVFVYGTSDYNPYGHQAASLASAFTAISHTSIHGIVS